MTARPGAYPGRASAHHPTKGQQMTHQPTPAARILRIVCETVIEANDVGGVDLNDLVDRLAAAGYSLPDEDAPAAAAEQRHTASTITDDDLDALYDEREQLLAELGGRDEEARERWIEQQLAQTGLKAMDFRNGMAMELEPARELVAHWVGAARAMLGDAPNYTETPVEMEVKVGESPERFAFVLQRVAPDALTPHQARQRAEERADKAEAAIDRARKLASRWAVLRAYGSAATELRAALDEQPEQSQTPAQHIGNGANAEDCPACRGTNPPYPFLCPGPDTTQETR